MAPPAPRTTERLPVWPRPSKASVGRGRATVEPERFAFSHEAGCCAELLEAAFGLVARAMFWTNSSSGVLPHVRVRAAGLRESSTPQELENCGGGAPAASFGVLRVEVGADEPTPLRLGVDESYSLDLTEEGGVLRAPSEWGALRGLETFLQLVQWDGERHVLCELPMALSDAPEFPWRELLIDTARHFLPIGELLRMLEAMSALKLNVLHWHLTDGAAFPFGSEALPQLPARGALSPSLVYSLDEMRHVVEEARLRGIRVVPELDMPAHAASWAFGMPEIVVSCPRRVAADGEGLEHGVNFGALHPLKEETYAAVETLLSELAAVFPDEYLHLGGDEVDGDCWLSDPLISKWASEARATPSGDWKMELQALFTARVAASAAALGKRVLLWDEALDFAGRLPTGGDAGGTGGGGGGAVTISVWRDWVRTSHERRDQALLRGHPVVWNSLAWYLDLPGNTWQSMYEVELPRRHAAGRGAGAGASDGAGLLGGATSSWAEHADATNLEPRVLIRAAAVAERLWSGKPSPLDVARQRLASLRCRMLRRGLRPSAVIPDHCGVPPLPLGLSPLASSAPAVPPPPEVPLPSPSPPRCPPTQPPAGLHQAGIQAGVQAAGVAGPPSLPVGSGLPLASLLAGSLGLNVMLALWLGMCAWHAGRRGMREKVD